jgi:hypothetical protein
MIDHALIEDCAYVTARSILECLTGCLREEELLDALEEIRARVRAGVECYAIKSRQNALEPSDN